MKLYSGNFNNDSGGGGFSLIEKLDVAVGGVTCAGTSFGTAEAITSLVNGFEKTVLLVTRTDSSHAGIILPSSFDILNCELQLIGDSRDGGSITIYAPSGEQFTGGGSSITMTDGQYLSLRRRFNYTASKNEWVSH